MLFLIIGMLGGTGPAADPGPGPAAGVRHIVLARLGREHVARTALRRGAGGETIVAWGERILEWPPDRAG